MPRLRSACVLSYSLIDDILTHCRNLAVTLTDLIGRRFQLFRFSTSRFFYASSSIRRPGAGLAGPPAAVAQTTNSGTDKFAQLETMLPTPNAYRTASGAPGPDYWQQRADYNIHVTLDDAKQAITGRETITYTNLSPDVLPYLWVQLDQNILDENSHNRGHASGAAAGPDVRFKRWKTMLSDFDGGFKIEAVTGNDGKALQHTSSTTP